MLHTVALFGEAEKGEYRTAYYIETLGQLADSLGHPPDESKGLYYAVQALLYRRGVIFFRVKEEGFSIDDYLLGLNFLQNKDLVPNLSAIGLPGMGNAHVIEASAPVCQMHESILLCNEHDLYDYLSYTSRG